MLQVTTYKTNVAMTSFALEKKVNIQGAIHAVSQLFETQCEDGGGLLLVDADNAFNSIKRSAGLWNARVLWALCSNSCSTFTKVMLF